MKLSEAFKEWLAKCVPDHLIDNVDTLTKSTELQKIFLLFAQIAWRGEGSAGHLKTAMLSI